MHDLWGCAKSRRNDERTFRACIRNVLKPNVFCLLRFSCSTPDRSTDPKPTKYKVKQNYNILSLILAFSLPFFSFAFNCRRIRFVYVCAKRSDWLAPVQKKKICRSISIWCRYWVRIRKCSNVDLLCARETFPSGVHNGINASRMDWNEQNQRHS